MSNNDDMEIDLDHGRDLRGMTDKSEQHKARRNKGDHCGI
jgi:primase-polymerase (primpol)-like protein